MPPSHPISHIDDRALCQRDHVLDAVQASNSKPVILKSVPISSPEMEIGKFLRSPPLKDDPRNHSIPLLDILEPENEPDIAILVFPLLRRLDSPPLASVREAVDFVEQTLEVSLIPNPSVRRSTQLVLRGLYSFMSTKLHIGKLSDLRVWHYSALS